MDTFNLSVTGALHHHGNLGSRFFLVLFLFWYGIPSQPWTGSWMNLIDESSGWPIWWYIFTFNTNMFQTLNKMPLMSIVLLLCDSHNFLLPNPLHELTSCQVDPRRGAQAFAGRPDWCQQVFQGVVELRVLQGVVPQSPKQLPLSTLRPSWVIEGITLSESTYSLKIQAYFYEHGVLSFFFFLHVKDLWDPSAGAHLGARIKFNICAYEKNASILPFGVKFAWKKKNC